MGNGFIWYDAGQVGSVLVMATSNSSCFLSFLSQEHIMSDALFRNCGYMPSHRLAETGRGCNDNIAAGCDYRSAVFGFLTHSDQFTPEVMQGTRNVSFENCGRRFRFGADHDGDERMDTVSARAQNWFDADGTASGRNEPTLIVSGTDTVANWWEVEDDGMLRTDIASLTVVYLLCPQCQWMSLALFVL